MSLQTSFTKELALAFALSTISVIGLIVLGAFLLSEYRRCKVLSPPRRLARGKTLAADSVDGSGNVAGRFTAPSALPLTDINHGM